jgi:hypothetical protein
MPDDVRPNVLVADLSFDKESLDFVDISQEKYSIDIIFKVAETTHNMEQGNIYLSAGLTSQLPGQKEVKINKMGTFNYKGNLQIYLKELLSFVPFSNTVLGLVLREKDPLSLE